MLRAGYIVICWIPSQGGIFGNEKVNLPARTSLALYQTFIKMLLWFGGLFVSFRGRGRGGGSIKYNLSIVFLELIKTS